MCLSIVPPEANQKDFEIPKIIGNDGESSLRAVSVIIPPEAGHEVCGLESGMVIARVGDAVANRLDTPWYKPEPSEQIMRN